MCRYRSSMIERRQRAFGRRGNSGQINIVGMMTSEEGKSLADNDFTPQIPRQTCGR